MKKYLLSLLLTNIFLFSYGQQNEQALAAQYFQNGEYAKAAILFEKLFEQTHNRNYYDQLLSAYLNSKQYDKAASLVKKQMRTAPNDLAYQIDMGNIYREQGLNDKASELYDNIIKNLSGDEFAIRDLASSFYKVKAYDLAVRTFVQGRKVLKNDEVFTFDLINLYRYKKDKVMLVQEYLNVLAKTPEQLDQAQYTLSTVFEDKGDYDILKSALLRRLQKDPQNIPYSQLLAWQFIQQGEYDMALRQYIALDKRQQLDGARVFDAASGFVNSKAYTTAIAAYQYLIEKGKENELYIPSKIELVNTRQKMITAGKYMPSDLLVLEKEYQSILEEFGKRPGTAFAIRQLANLQAYYLNKPKNAEQLLEELLVMPGVPQYMAGQIKSDLGDIYVINNEPWEARLVYGQLEKDFEGQPLSNEARFKNARLAYFQGDLSWAKAQVDILKASTSQLIANDALNLSLLIADNTQTQADTNALKMYARADMQIFGNKLDLAQKTLDSIDTKYPGNSLADDILMAKAKLLLKKNEMNEAIVCLQKIVDNYRDNLWADDALFMMADLYENRMDQKDKAKELYQKLINDYPGSLYVAEARKRFRALRGDHAGT